MLDDNHLFQRAATSAYASMAAFTAAANMYNSFYPTAPTNIDPVNFYTCPDVKRERLDPKVDLKLEDLDLWTRFSSLGNEMIITKNGRRLFPNLRVSVSNLDPNTKYMFLLDIVPLDDHRYKFNESAWAISGKAEPHIYGRYYVHPDGPQTGAQWMKQYILFNKVKVTNSPMHSPNHILLNSMHRYIPRIHIVQATDSYSIRTGPLNTYIFQETAFIAVTAYQNDHITKLKINNNPFAKGFRETQPNKKNHAKSLKRLHSSSIGEKPSKFNENRPSHRVSKGESSPSSSLNGINSDSPTFPSSHRETIIDSTTPPYLDNSVGDHEQDNSDVIISPNKFDAMVMPSNPYPSYQFPSNSFYNGYPTDPSTAMFYNSSYNNYLPAPSGSLPANSSTSMPFGSYGRYPSPMYYPPNYNQSFF